MIQIMGGKFKGRRLKHPEMDRVRATSHKVREAVFSIIQTLLPEARFLDGFAGTGAMGIEAASRGASQVTFIEPNPKILLQNISEFESDFTVIRASFDAGIKRLKTQFDLIYMDPPWQNPELFESGLRGISKFDILAPCGWIICEHHRKQSIPYSEFFELRCVRCYGDVQLSILK